MRALPLILLLPLLLQANPAAAEETLKVETLLQTTRAWDGSPYRTYPNGQPEPTLLKFSIPAHTALPWHTHEVVNVAYVLSGVLIVEKKDSPERITLRAGDSLAELVGIAHRGYTTEQPVELLVFYANTPGLPLSSKLRD